MWGSNHNCVEQLFCPRHCLDFVEDTVRHKHLWPVNKYGHGTCQLMARAHTGLYDYEQGVKAGRPRARPVFITMLREPVQRVLSEFAHVTHNLVAQFGDRGYGKAWDYNYTGRPHDIEDFLDCETCRMGASNRQTRMLAGLFTTGVLNASVSDDMLLEHALANLERMPFIGITERFADSMLLLKQTLPTSLKQFTEYTIKSHHHDGLSQELKVSEANLRRIEELNRLDSHLYERAKHLFEARWKDMIEHEVVPLRFIPDEPNSQSSTYTLQLVEDATISGGGTDEKP